jgi:hypothetical protein
MNIAGLISELSRMGYGLEAGLVNENPETGLTQAMRSLQRRLHCGEDADLLMKAATVLADVELLLLAELN